MATLKTRLDTRPMTYDRINKVAGNDLTVGRQEWSLTVIQSLAIASAAIDLIAHTQPFYEINEEGSESICWVCEVRIVDDERTHAPDCKWSLLADAIHGSHYEQW